MAWTGSKVFAATLLDGLGNTTALDLDADTLNAILYDDTITPDNTVTSANTAKNAGVWASGKKSNGGWGVDGIALTSKTWLRSTNVMTLDAADTANGTAATLTDVYGVHVYDDTLTTPVADQGVCYNYLGGPNGVTAGTLTVVWNALGLFTLTAT
jgi:hypothetical protein